MEGHCEDEKTVKMGEEGPLGLQEGVEVGDEAAANLSNFKENQNLGLIICYLQPWTGK